MADDDELPASVRASLERKKKGVTVAPATTAPATGGGGIGAEAQRLLKIAGESSGAQFLSNLLGGGTRAALARITGGSDPAAEQEFLGALHGAASEPKRMYDELIKSGQSLAQGDLNTAADHLWFAIPFAGAAGAQMKEYLEKGDVRGAFTHGLSTLAPYLTHGAGDVGATVSETAGDVAAQAKGAVKNVKQEAFAKGEPIVIPLRRGPLKGELTIPGRPVTQGAVAGAGVGTTVGGVVGHGPGALIGGTTGAIVGGGIPIVRSAIRGAAKGLRERQAVPRTPAWFEVPEAPPDLPPPAVVPEVPSAMPSGREVPTVAERVAAAEGVPPAPTTARPPLWEGLTQTGELPPPEQIQPVTPSRTLQSGRKVPTPEERVAAAETKPEVPVKKPAGPTLPEGVDPALVEAISKSYPEHLSFADQTPEMQQEIIDRAQGKIPARLAKPPERKTPPPAETQEPAQPGKTLEELLEESLAQKRAAKAEPQPEPEVPEPEVQEPQSEPEAEATAEPGVAGKQEDPYEYTRVTSQIHIRGKKLFGRKWRATPHVQEIWGPGAGWDDLNRVQHAALNDFLEANDRMPTPEDVENGSFNPHYDLFGPQFARGGLVAMEAPSVAIAQELRKQGLTADMARLIAPEDWGELSRAAGVTRPGQYSIRDTVAHMRKLEAPKRLALGSTETDYDNGSLPGIVQTELVGQPKRRKPASAPSMDYLNLTPTRNQILQSLGPAMTNYAPLPSEEPEAIRQPEASTTTVPPVPRKFIFPKPVEKALSTVEDVNAPVGVGGTGLIDPGHELDRVVGNWGNVIGGLGTIDRATQGWLGGQGAANKPTTDETLGGLSNVIRGGADLFGPLLMGTSGALAAARDPLNLALSAGSGIGSQWLANNILNDTNLGPGAKSLTSDIAGLVGSGIPEMWKSGNFGSERGSITLAPPGEKTDTAPLVIKGAQKVMQGATEFGPWAESMVNDLGEQVKPHLQELWPEANKAATRASQDVKRRSIEDLGIRMPDEGRVVSQDPTRTVTGQPFHSLNLEAPGEGYLPLRVHGPEAAETQNQQMWQDAIRESEAGGGTTAADAVGKTGARPPNTEFWDNSFSLPARPRFWYELSGEGFTGGHVDIPQELQPRFIDTVAATSGGAKPYGNAKRAIGSFAEDLQKIPINTDLRDPTSVRNALNRVGEKLQTLKYRSFSGTMQYTSGLSLERPLTTNDVQVADMFGIKGEDIGKNPVLYEVMSRYFQKLRDAQNELSPQGAQPYESWQAQALGWVHNRAVKDPKSQYDDYSMVFPRIIQELHDAGIPTPDGKITMETLMDPRTPDVMSSTRPQFMASPVATVETATKLTPRGAAAADTYEHLKTLDPDIPWVRNAKQGYEQIQRNTMRALGRRSEEEPSLISHLMSAITGRKVDVSRIDTTAYGTFNQKINPNMRIPMTGAVSSGEWANLNPVQKEGFLAILGKDLNQKAMASSHFEAVPHGQHDTFSVFLNRYDGVVDQDAINNFSNAIDYPVNVARHPNGTVLYVNIGDSKTRPTLEQVSNAAHETFNDNPNIHSIDIVPQKYASNYVEDTDYNGKIDALHRQPKTQQSAPGDTGAVGGERPAKIDRGYLTSTRKAIQKIARDQDKRFGDWHTETQDTIANPPRTRKPTGKLGANETTRPAVAGGPGGELPPPTQGAPGGAQKRPEANPELQQVVNAYNAQNGLPPVDHQQYHPLDEAFGRRVADAYDNLKTDNSGDPRVRASYAALARETKAQYDHLIHNGYTLEPWTQEGQPYKNSHEMVADLKNNKHLYFFTGGEPHPFMSAVDPDTGLTYNDMFRAVHDAWAHATGGFGFGPRGEEMAHDMHSQSYSPLARQAMSTETRGQNSWVNFGRHNYDAEGNPLHVPAAEKPYAEQKVDLLPPQYQIRAGERYAKPKQPKRRPIQIDPSLLERASGGMISSLRYATLRSLRGS
jgi:hypothetical protein